MGSFLTRQYLLLTKQELITRVLKHIPGNSSWKIFTRESVTRRSIIRRSECKGHRDNLRACKDYTREE